MSQLRTLIGVALLALLGANSAHADQAHVQRRGASRQLKSGAHLRPEAVNYDGWNHLKAQVSRLEIKPVIVMNFLGSQDFDHSGALMHTGESAKAFSGFSGGIGLGASIDYRITEQFLSGLRVDWFSASTNAAESQSPAGGAASLQYGLSALPVYATATYRGNLSDHFSAGVCGGPGLATYFHVDQTVTGSSIAGLANRTTNYNANPFTVFGMAFFDYDPSRDVSFYLETGYRMISTRHLSSDSDVLKDSTGQNLNVDVSSLFLGLGATVRL